MASMRELPSVAQRAPTLARERGALRAGLVALLAVSACSRASSTATDAAEARIGDGATLSIAEEAPLPDASVAETPDVRWRVVATDEIFHLPSVVIPDGDPGRAASDGASLEGAARDFFTAHGAEIFRIRDQVTELRIEDVSVEGYRSRAIFGQWLGDLRISEAGLTVEFREGAIASVTGTYLPKLAPPKLSADDAVRVARADMSHRYAAKRLALPVPPEHLCLIARPAKPIAAIAYSFDLEYASAFVQLEGQRQPVVSLRWRYVIDADSGRILVGDLQRDSELPVPTNARL